MGLTLSAGAGRTSVQCTKGSLQPANSGLILLIRVAGICFGKAFGACRLDLCNDNHSHYNAGMTASDPPSPAPASPDGIDAPTAPASARWRSEDLLLRQAQVEIDHGGQIYRLRVTAQGKLILTK
jgi:hemin uptake protein HemP